MNLGLAIAITASVAAGVCAAGADAQDFTFSIGEFRSAGAGGGGIAPAMSATQLRRYADVLDLDETQRLVADELLADYRERYDAAIGDYRKAVNELHEEAAATGDFSVYGERQGPLREEWGKEADRLETQLIESLRSLLRDDQMARWETFERERRRAELLPKGRLGGESVDVTLLATALPLDEETRAVLLELFEQYALEIDRALQHRDAALEPLTEQWRESFGEQERMEEIWEEATRKRLVVRNLNRRFIDLIATECSEDLAAQLRESWLEAAYPVAYEDTKAELTLEAAAELDSVSADQHAVLDAIARSFEQQLRPLRQKIIAQFMEDELEPPTFLASVIRTPGGGEGQAIMLTTTVGGEEEEEDPMSDLLRERYNLSKDAIDQIERTLSPEQMDAIPAIRPQMHRPRGMRFDL